jgi:hypothetical protein
VQFDDIFLQSDYYLFENWHVIDFFQCDGDVLEFRDKLKTTHKNGTRNKWKNTHSQVRVVIYFLILIEHCSLPLH